MINEWLTERLQQSLSAYQFTCLSFIVKLEETNVALHDHSAGAKVFSFFK
uniref:4a-hydroxytetrahydrobiopterin dehydratase n=1 Tax=Heterorhabditis bacteriophora TaxID=37862 RepID=A0A1I7XJ11_HETBA